MSNLLNPSLKQVALPFQILAALGLSVVVFSQSNKWCECRNYRSVFDITSEVFRKRALSCFMVWRNNFLTIGEGRTELYGMLWMSITYIVILGFSANLNEYFIAQPSFRFQKQLMLEGMGITALFQISSIFIYAAVVKCLKGEIPYK